MDESESTSKAPIGFELSNAKVTKVEIIWILMLVCYGYSSCTNENMDQIFSVKFPYFETTKSFSISKSIYFVNYRQVAYFKSLLN